MKAVTMNLTVLVPDEWVDDGKDGVEADAIEDIMRQRLREAFEAHGGRIRDPLVNIEFVEDHPTLG